MEARDKSRAGSRERARSLAVKTYIPATLVSNQYLREPEWRCNDHCLCSESLDVRRQVRWDGCGIGTVSRVSGKAMDRFQCTWVAMIGEMYELIVEYLGNRFR